MNHQPFNPEGPEAMFVKSDKLIQLGDPIGAATLLSCLIAEYPDFGRAHNHLGFLYETKFRDFAQAEEHYKACLKLSPEYPALYHNYAVLLSSQHRFTELETLLKQALEVPGVKYSKIYNEYGIMHESQSKFMEALTSYRKAIQYAYSPKDLKIHRASIHRTQGKRGDFGLFALGSYPN